MDNHMFRMACMIHLDHAIGRYLLACSGGSASGAEKALRHKEIVDFYVSVFKGHSDPETVRRYHEKECNELHAVSRELTDYLDERIGFPIKVEPEIDILVPRFFEEFHRIALRVLGLAYE